MITLEARNARLDAAKALVLAGWCTRSNARDPFGNATLPEDRAAVAFCAVGAAIRVSVIPGDAAGMGRALKGALAKLGFEPSISKYNDAPGRTKYEVAALFDHAKAEPL